MNWHREWYKLAAMIAGALALYFLPEWAPVGWLRGNPFSEGVGLTHWYAHEHLLTALVPAIFIAGAISVFVSQVAVIRYLGPRPRGEGVSPASYPPSNNAKRQASSLPQGPAFGAYGVAAVSGTILAVCSCAVLPMFAGIYRMGAGLGPASTFLYSGPAISVLAIVLTARVLGWELGLARTIAAVASSVVIGLLMHLIFRRDEAKRAEVAAAQMPAGEARPLWQSLVFFGCLVGVLVFGNSCNCRDEFWAATGIMKWQLAVACALVLGVVLVRWFHLAWWKVALTAAGSIAAGVGPWANPTLAYAVAALGLSIATATDKGPAGEWFAASWSMAKQILPLLAVGVLAAGVLLGQPGGRGLIPPECVKALVGRDPGPFLAMSGWTGWAEGLARTVWPVWTNFFAAVFGAFMYFATLTEVPIVQGLIVSGMGKGPALALLLAGPAVSLPSMLVILSVIGTRKTAVYVLLVIAAATAAGLVFDAV